MKENSPSIRIKEELSGLPTGSVYLNLHETFPPPLFSSFHFNDTENWVGGWAEKENKGSHRNIPLDILSLSFSP